MPLLRIDLANVSLPHQHILLAHDECQGNFIATLSPIFCLLYNIADHSVSKLSRCAPNLANTSAHVSSHCWPPLVVLQCSASFLLPCLRCLASPTIVILAMASCERKVLLQPISQLQAQSANF